MDLPAELQASSEYPKIYWKDRETNLRIAGVGLGPPSEISFGWRLFRKTVAPHWADFAFEQRFSPRLVLKSRENSRLKDPALISPLFKRYLPDYPAWEKTLQKTLLHIERGDFAKCVLARECQLTFERPIDPWPIVAKLERNLKGVYLICIQPTERSAFIAASPEKLFSRQGKMLEIEALASTRILQAEEEFQTEKDSKDQREFRLVEDSIRDALKKVSLKKLAFSEQQIKKTSHLKHLYSQLKVHLGANISDENLLDCLHPTAALLGYPREKVLEFFEENEPFDRGLYGAPIGCITEESSTWAVGIRSCLMFESTIRLYSGAGIVEGSHPESEWEEINHKLSSFQDVFL